MLEHLPYLIRNVQDMMSLIKDLQDLLYSHDLEDSEKINQMKIRLDKYCKSKTHRLGE